LVEKVVAFSQQGLGRLLSAAGFEAKQQPKAALAIADLLTY
jgi:hypothetical protein